MTPTIHEQITRRITLYYREGSSDKEYQASIEPREDKFVVNFAYGRRGTTLQTGTKTQTPLDFETATRIFNRLVSEKRAKGYTEGPEGTPYQHTEKENRATNILPQLLNPIEEHEVERFILDTRYCAQEKYDGRRMLLGKDGAEVHGINRKGLLIGLADPIFQSAKAIPGDFILDGECVGDLFHVFDLLQLTSLDLRQESYQQRLVALMNLLGLAMQRNIRLGETAFAPGQKRDLLNWLKRENREGIVFKRLDAPYTPGANPVVRRSRYHE
jgi:bifunctional non-homologous end joining protein LigD